jgi:hypothetical protein
LEEGKGVEPSGLSPGPVFETGRVTRRTAFQMFSEWSRMQDLNPLNLFTRQVLWPVELIRQWLQCGAPGGNRTHDRHVISVPHLPSVLPAQVPLERIELPSSAS